MVFSEKVLSSSTAMPATTPPEVPSNTVPGVTSTTSLEVPSTTPAPELGTQVRTDGEDQMAPVGQNQECSCSQALVADSAL